MALSEVDAPVISRGLDESAAHPPVDDQPFASVIVPAAAEGEADAEEVVLMVEEETMVAEAEVVGRTLDDEAELMVDDLETAAAGAEKTFIE